MTTIISGAGLPRAALYGWREPPRGGKSGTGEVEEVKVITKFWVNGESETAQAVSALPAPFIQCGLASLNFFVESCRVGIRIQAPAVIARVESDTG